MGRSKSVPCRQFGCSKEFARLKTESTMEHLAAQSQRSPIPVSPEREKTTDRQQTENRMRPTRDTWRFEHAPTFRLQTPPKFPKRKSPCGAKYRIKIDSQLLSEVSEVSHFYPDGLSSARLTPSIPTLSGVCWCLRCPEFAFFDHRHECGQFRLTSVECSLTTLQSIESQSS